MSRIARTMSKLSRHFLLTMPSFADWDPQQKSNRLDNIWGQRVEKRVVFKMSSRGSHASSKYPPAQNQYMQEKILGKTIFARIHAGLVFILARIQENSFEGSFSRMLAKFSREVISVRIHVAPVFARVRIQEKFLANYLCIGFVPGGTVRPKNHSGSGNVFRGIHF